MQGAECVGQRGQFEFYALFNRKPMKMFKNTILVCVLRQNVHQQQHKQQESLADARVTRDSSACMKA